MPYNGAGVYSPPAADFPAVSGTLIQSTKFNNVINDLATGLTTALTKDGQTTPTANLPMGGFKHLVIADGALRNQYASLGQLQDGTARWGGVAGGTADALTLTLTPTLSGYAAGQWFSFQAGASPNTGPATLAINGLLAKSFRLNGSALVAGDIEANKYYSVLYDGFFHLYKGSSALSGVNSWAGTNTFLDGSLKIVGSADGTKKLKFDVGGFTTASERTATPPDYDFRIMSQTHGADIASAGTLNLDTATGDLVDVTGTTTITAITLAEGKTVVVRFTGALTLTNGASLVLPGSANITTVAGDYAVFRGYAAGVVRCASYDRGTGIPVAAPTATQGSSLILLDTQIASASANLQFTTGINSTYSEYLLILTGIVPATNTVQLNLNMSINGGSSYDSGGGSYASAMRVLGANTTDYSAASAGTSNIGLNGVTNLLSNITTNGGWNGEVRLFRPSSATDYKLVKVSGTYAGTVALATVDGAGAGISAALQGSAVNALNFQMSAGNIASGTIRLYGVKTT